jgi:hypothetical protein
MTSSDDGSSISGISELKRKVNNLRHIEKNIFEKKQIKSVESTESHKDEDSSMDVKVTQIKRDLDNAS